MLADPKNICLFKIKYLFSHHKQNRMVLETIILNINTINDERDRRH